MSLPRRAYDPRRVCLLPLPPVPSFLKTTSRTFGIYISGGLFALGWWFFFDALIISSLTLKKPLDETIPYYPPETYMTFSDWIPGLLATLGMIIVNLIDKSHLTDGEDGSFSFGAGSGGWGSDSAQWRARLFLFVGFTLLAGGMAGSITVLVMKYLIPTLSPDGYEYYGVCNVLQNAGIMASTMLLWVAQNRESDYEYNLTL